MKLSEAIRLGALLHPQIFGTLKSPVGTCALGAAAEAAGLFLQGTWVGVVNTRLFHTWPLLHALELCPECELPECGGALSGRLLRPSTHVPMFELISYLNDEHRWTREKIADWVERVENERAEKEEKTTTEDSLVRM